MTWQETQQRTVRADRHGFLLVYEPDGSSHSAYSATREGIQTALIEAHARRRVLQGPPFPTASYWVDVRRANLAHWERVIDALEGMTCHRQAHGQRVVG